ncbi:MAG: DUF4831 family protein [Paludibacteraceae bacterium]|nr:DUF4831 family protein [Paludibacteraceae bacterium]
MKNCIVSLICLLSTLTLNAEGLKYFLPKTNLILKVEYEQVETRRGQYSQYAEKYLGTKDILTRDETNYRLLSLSVSAQTVADTSKAYSLTDKNLQPLFKNISLTADGRLTGINTTPSCETQTDNLQIIFSNLQPATKPDILFEPQLESQMLATSVARMAEQTAKQIYHLREARQALLTGESEHQPQDGQAMQLTLKQLDEQEAILTQMFIGTTIVKKHTKTILCELQHTEKQVIARFSQFQGLVPNDDLSGEPIYLIIDNLQLANDNQPKKAEKYLKLYESKTQHFYLLHKQQRWVEGNISVAQWQNALYLPKKMFVNGKTELLLNDKTATVKELKNK